MAGSVRPELGSPEHYGIKLTDEELLHYGKKGMKWGVRRGKGTTGVSRHRGALMDRNANAIKLNERALSGEAAKIRVKIGSALMGKEAMRRNMETTVKNLNEQNARLRAGKLNVGDRIGLLTVQPIELLVSARPR